MGRNDMAAIILDSLSLPEAEEAIAELWSCLEEHDIPSPVMSVHVRPGARITMGFSFEKPFWAKLVSLRLSRWMRSTVPSRMPCAMVVRQLGPHLVRAGETTTSLEQLGDDSPKRHGAKSRG
jgi:hypothetical protein